MTTFSFTGFTAGSAVALSATQGGVTDNGSVAEWGINTNLGSVSILTRQADHLFAPSAVWLEATNVSGFNVTEGGTPVYDPSFHEITYVWTVRGQPLQPFSAPESMVAGWNNPNVMYGKKVAFHFAESGSYTVDLWAIDSAGTTGVAETTIVVQNEAAADTRYSGTNTICFSSSGDFNGAPSGAQLVTVSSAGDISARTDATHSSPKRFLFRRGDTFNNVSMFVRANAEYFGAFGSGAKPVLNENGSSSIFKTGSGSQHTFSDLDCRGRWDSTTETGTALSTGPVFFRTTSSAANILFSECVFDGFSLVEVTPGTDSAPGSMIIFADTFITNWRDYGLFSNVRDSDKFLAVIGCRITQHVDALNGGAKNGDFNTHGPIRLTRIKNVIYAQLDLFSRTGWSALSPDRADQPCIRHNSSPRANDNTAVFDRLVCEGGFKVIMLEGQNNNEQEYAGNHLLDRILAIGTAKTSTTFFSIEYGGTTLRNVLGIMPNVLEYHNNWQAAVVLNINQFSSENANAPINHYNCTYVNLQSDANDKAGDWLVQTVDDFTNVTQENNAILAPDIGAGAATALAPLDLSTPIPGVTPRYKGVRYNGDASMNTTYASPATLPLPRPLSGSAAIDAGDIGLKAYLDFLGTPRPATGNERGALLES